MSDAKITELTELLSVDDGDVLVIVDDPAGSPATKKITVANLLAGVSGSTDAADVSIADAGNHFTATDVEAALAEIITDLGSYVQTSAVGTAAALAVDTDGTLAANSDTRLPSQKAVKTAIANAVTGLLEFKGSTDASGNPNYPAASKGDSYVVSVAGKIGGSSGTAVDVGDVYFAIADNAGGTQASVGSSWDLLEHDLVGALLSANNLSDVASASTALSNLGGIAASLLTTRGDIIARGASAAARLALGSSGALLRSNGTDPVWTALATILLDILTTRGDLLTVNSTPAVVRKAIGSANQALETDGNDVLWRSKSACDVQVEGLSFSSGAPPTVVSFSTGNSAVENKDTDAYHDMTTNPSRFIAPRTGWYMIQARADRKGDTSTTGLITLALCKNLGGTLTIGTGPYLAYQSFTPGAGQGFISCAAPVYLTAGDYVEVFYAQVSGSARSTNFYFSMVYMGA